MKSFAMAIIGLLVAGSVSISTANADAASIQRVYAGVSKADVWRAVMTSLADHDLPVVASDFERGKIRARQHNYLNAAWASCRAGHKRSFDPTDSSNLRVRSSPLYRGVDLRLEITETNEGTRLAVDPSYSNVDQDTRRRQFAFQVPCQSTGILEQDLFSAPGEAG